MIIFGKTRQQRHLAQQAKIVEMLNGRKEFAILPRQLEDGRWVWLNWCYAYYYGGTHDTGELFLYSNSPDMYSPVAKYYLTKLQTTEQITNVWKIL
jgi:hypothetical protein